MARVNASRSPGKKAMLREAMYDDSHGRKHVLTGKATRGSGKKLPKAFKSKAKVETDPDTLLDVRRKAMKPAKPRVAKAKKKKPGKTNALPIR